MIQSCTIWHIFGATLVHCMRPGVFHISRLNFPPKILVIFNYIFYAFFSTKIYKIRYLRNRETKIFPTIPILNLWVNLSHDSKTKKLPPAREHHRGREHFGQKVVTWSYQHFCAFVKRVSAPTFHEFAPEFVWQLAFVATLTAISVQQGLDHFRALFQSTHFRAPASAHKMCKCANISCKFGAKLYETLWHCHSFDLNLISRISIL